MLMNSQITNWVVLPPIENFETAVNNTFAHGIGSRVAESNLYFDGYLADVHFIDGQALAPTEFGELDSNGVWAGEGVSLGRHGDIRMDSTSTLRITAVMPHRLEMT